MKSYTNIWLMVFVAITLSLPGCKNGQSSDQKTVFITVLDWGGEHDFLGKVRVESSEEWKNRIEQGAVAIPFTWSAKMDLVRKQSDKMDGSLFVAIDKAGQTVMCVAASSCEFVVHIEIPDGRFEEFKFRSKAGLQVFSKRIEEFSKK